MAVTRQLIRHECSFPLTVSVVETIAIGVNLSLAQGFPYCGSQTSTWLKDDGVARKLKWFKVHFNKFNEYLFNISFCLLFRSNISRALISCGNVVIAFFCAFQPPMTFPPWCSKLSCSLADSPINWGVCVCAQYMHLCWVLESQKKTSLGTSGLVVTVLSITPLYSPDFWPSPHH